MKKIIMTMLILVMMIPAYLPAVSADNGGIYNYEELIYWLNTEDYSDNHLYYSLESGQDFGWPTEPTVLSSPYGHRSLWIQDDWYIPSHITLVNIPIYVEKETCKVNIDGVLIQQPTEEGSFYSALNNSGSVTLGKDAVIVGDVDVSDGASVAMEKGARISGNVNLASATLTGEDNYIQGCIYTYSAANDEKPVSLKGSISANWVSVAQGTQLQVDGRLQIRTRIRGEGKLTVLSGGELIFNSGENYGGSTGCGITLESGASMYTLCNYFTVSSGAVFQLKKNSTVYANGYFGVEARQTRNGYIKGEGTIQLYEGYEILVQTEDDEYRFSANDNIPNVDSTVKVLFQETHSHAEYKNKRIFDECYHWYPCDECSRGNTVSHTFENKKLTEGYKLYACTGCQYYYLNIDQSGTDINNGLEWSVTDGVLKLIGSGSSDWMDWPLEFKESVTEVQVTEGITDVGMQAFAGYARLEKVVLADTVTQIRDYAFQNCRNLREIVLPQGVTVIGASAFENCSSLQSIQLPRGLKEIGDMAFAQSGLTSIKIPGKVETMGYYPFYRCEKLKNVRFSKGVTEIPEEAFLGCSHLTTVHLPVTMERIGTEAFRDCPKLKTVYYDGTETMFATIEVGWEEDGYFMKAAKSCGYRMPDTSVVKNEKENTLQLDIQAPEAETTANTRFIAVGYNQRGVLTSVGTAQESSTITISAEDVDSVQVMLFDLLTLKPLSYAEAIDLH